MVFVIFGYWKHRFTLSSGCCVFSSCLWFSALTLDHCQMANKMIIFKDVNDCPTKQTIKLKKQGRRGGVKFN